MHFLCVTLHLCIGLTFHLSSMCPLATGHLFGCSVAEFGVATIKSTWALLLGLNDRCAKMRCGEQVGVHPHRDRSISWCCSMSTPPPIRVHSHHSPRRSRLTHPVFLADCLHLCLWLIDIHAHVHAHADLTPPTSACSSCLSVRPVHGPAPISSGCCVSTLPPFRPSLQSPTLPGPPTSS